MDPVFDLLIIGGGINGTGLARDAAGRGLRVCLVEAGDLGGGTSCASTKLLHGGLRYLEFGDFRMVRTALIERELLLGLMPHLARPQKFVLPIGPGSRHRWWVRLGLWLYDQLGESLEMPRSSVVDFDYTPPATPLKPDVRHAYRYWDGWVDDARLVIANARGAADLGADVRPRTPIARATFAESLWRATTAQGDGIAARRIVNCAGPWAAHVARDVLGLADPPSLALVRGTHIVTHKVARGKEAMMLQQPDGRIVFLIPYQGQFTLIGTTEVNVASPDDRAPSADEQAYLIEAANRYLARPIREEDIVHSFAGIRPLVFEPGKRARETTRDWRLIHHKGVPALTVIGGKITTYRRVAEQVMAAIAPKTKAWTARVPLPGGDIPRDREESARQAWDRWLRGFIGRHPDYDPHILKRLARLYGTHAPSLVEAGLGLRVGGVFEGELIHLVTREWAETADDVLWRRTKLGLVTTPADRKAIEAWLSAFPRDAQSPAPDPVTQADAGFREPPDPPNGSDAPGITPGAVRLAQRARRRPRSR